MAREPRAVRWFPLAHASPPDSLPDVARAANRLTRVNSPTAPENRITEEVLAGISRALVVTAHPDDVDFGAGGTIAVLTDRGVEVTYCICTDGDAGGFDPAVPRSEIPRIRRAEQRAAGAVLGVHDVRYLGYADGALEVTQALRRDISRVIRQVRPDVVITQSAYINYERIYASHPDHRAAGEAALIAVYPDARNPFAHPVLLNEEGLDAWSAPMVWVMAHPTRNGWIDTTDTFDRKVAALHEHVSQTEHMDDLPGRIRPWGEGMAAEAGFAAGRLAEGFYVINSA